MPKGAKGEKRPADVIGNAVTVMRTATGEEDEALTDDGKDEAAISLGRRAWKAIRRWPARNWVRRRPVRR